MRQKCFLLSLFIFFLAFHSKADWPFGKGRKLLFPSVSYASSQRNFDSKGNSVPLGAAGNSFTSTTMGLFFGYGIGRRVDFSASIPFVSQNLKTPNGNLTNAGFGDALFNFSFHFPSEDLKSYFTIKTGMFIPMYAGQNTPSLGYGNNGLSLGANYSFSPSNDMFIVGDFAHVRYFSEDGSGPNQNTYGFTIGKSFHQFHMFTVNLTHVRSVSVNKTFSVDLPQNKDFSGGKISVGYGRRANRMMMPFLQVFFSPYGRNTGASYGVSLSIISKLPL